MKANNAIIYARVSSQQQEKEGFSIPKQIERCNKYALRNNLKVKAIYQETESAKNSGRQEFEKALKILSQGESQHLIVEKTDRLTRNLVDMVNIDDLIMKKNITLHFVRNNCIISKDSPPGDLLQFDILSSFDRYYSKDLSEKVKKGVKGCFEAGYWPQKEKIGYYRDKNTKSKALLIDKTQAPIIKRIFERASTGMYTLKELRDDAVELGLRTTKG